MPGEESLVAVAIAIAADTDTDQGLRAFTQDQLSLLVFPKLQPFCSSIVFCFQVLCLHTLAAVLCQSTILLSIENGLGRDLHRLVSSLYPTGRDHFPEGVR